MAQQSMLKPYDFLRDYEIVRLIGKGGMAEVYEAAQARVAERHVAVKVMNIHSANNSEFVQRFQRETHTLVQLENPHILPVYDSGSDGDYHFIVMRLIEGGTLEDRCRSEPLSLPQVRFLIDHIAEALDHAHGKQIVHRDLKPSNILLDARGNPYVADFGIAKLLQTHQTTLNLTQDRMLGTPAYMAPEQFGSGTVDARADQFALGIIIYELLTGSQPITADTPYAYIQHYTTREVPVYEGLREVYGDDVAQIVQQAVAINPDDRHPSIVQFVDTFLHATQHAGVERLVNTDLDPDTYPVRPASFNGHRATPPPPHNQRGGLDTVNLSAQQVARPPAPPPAPPAHHYAQSRPPSRPAQPEPSVKVGRQFHFSDSVTLTAPTVCPVTLGRADHPITIPTGFGKPGQTIYYSAQFGEAYHALSPAFVGAHLLLVAGVILLAFIVEPLLLLPGLTLYAFAWEPLSRLRGPKAHEARQAVRIRRVKGKLQFTVAHQRYAKAFIQANRQHWRSPR